MPAPAISGPLRAQLAVTQALALEIPRGACASRSAVATHGKVDLNCVEAQ